VIILCPTMPQAVQINPPQGPQLPSQEDRDLYILYRAQVVSEDNLTNVRVTWLILMQGILLALLAGALYQNQNLGPVRVEHVAWLKDLLCLFGISGALVIGVGDRRGTKANPVFAQKIRRSIWRARQGARELTRRGW
jgi:uncharacterized integral membrane protein